MIVVGVTGGVGSGKSTVAKMLKRLGATVLDADELAHRAIEPGTAAWRRIRRQFGKTVFHPDGTIHRRALGELVFRDPVALARLEAMVHPAVIRETRRALRALKRHKRARCVVLDVPLLLETGMQRLVNAIVVVSAPDEVQRRRLRAKGLTNEELATRQAAQWDLSAKVALADYVVDNRDGIAHTRRQVTRIWKQLLELTRQPRG